MILQNKKIMFLIGVFTTLLVVVFTIVGFRTNSKTISLPATNLTSQTEEGRTIPTPPADLTIPDSSGPKTISSAKHIGVLLLGYGGAGHEGGFLSDVILLAYFDIEHKKLALIHIPRDLWVSIPTNSTPISTKINAALAMGTRSGNYPIKDLPKDAILRGSYLSKQAVKQVTGLDIDFVVGIDFNNFNKMIDSLGGVDVTVSPAFDDPWYPIKGRELELCGLRPEDVTAMSATMSGFNLEKQFPCRYEHLVFPSGLNHMNGETGLKFVRSRHSSSDFARGERQIALLKALQTKLLSLGVLDKIPAFYKSLSGMIKTDISLDNVTEFAPVLQSLSSFKTTTIGLSTANVLQSSSSKSGGSFLIPQAGENNWSNTNSFITKQLSQ